MTRIFAVAASARRRRAIGALSYAAFSSDGTKTVVRQVTVAGAVPTAAASNQSVTDVYDSASKGVVEITVSVGSSGYPYGGQRGQAQGSGFVYDTTGHVVTNQHVVDGAGSISVMFSNGATYKATLVGSDPSTDLAVLKVNAPASALHPLAARRLERRFRWARAWSRSAARSGSKRPSPPESSARSTVR